MTMRGLQGQTRGLPIKKEVVSKGQGRTYVGSRKEEKNPGNKKAMNPMYFEDKREYEED